MICWESRTDRDKRREAWRNGESLAVERGESGFGSLEERIRGLTERIEGMERGTWRMEEKRRNTGSSSDGEEGNGRWKWDGGKLVVQGGISRSCQFEVEATKLEVCEGDFGARYQENRVAGGEEATGGQVKSKLRTSGDQVGFQERGPGFPGGASSCDARSWLASVVLRFGERAVGVW